MKYINKKVYGIPALKKLGHKTSFKKGDMTKYVYKVEINGYTYYKVHLKLQDISKIKYFKKLKTAQIFVEMLRINPYL